MLNKEMKKGIKYSVVVPVYNEEGKFFKEEVISNTNIRPGDLKRSPDDCFFYSVNLVGGK